MVEQIIVAAAVLAFIGAIVRIRQHARAAAPEPAASELDLKVGVRARASSVARPAYSGSLEV